MDNEPTKKMPGAVYAAAGVGDLAYQRLRKVPAAVTRLRERAGATDTDQLRETARRNATAVLASARAAGQRASQRATVIYHDLAARGEQVMAERVEARRQPADTDPTAAIEAPLAADAPKADAPDVDVPAAAATPEQDEPNTK